jgi:Ca-activated chloride channel family protein
LDEEGPVIPQDLTYNFPSAGFGFFLIFIFFWLFWLLFNYRKDTLNSFADPMILDKIAFRRDSGIYWSKVLAFALIWIFAVGALMQPKGNGHYPEEAMHLGGKGAEQPQGLPVEVRRKAHEVIFLIDASASMGVPDSRTGASRLDFAKDIADQIASRLQGETGALYAFTSEIAPLSPSTNDYLFLRLMIRQVHINEGEIPGTDLINALASMRKKYFQTPDAKNKTLILLSDGGDTYIESLQGKDKEQALDGLLDILENAESMNLRVYTIGLGSLEGENVPDLVYQGKPVHSALDEEILQRIAHKGRGEYYPSREYTSIELADRLVASMRQDNQFLDAKALIQSMAAGKKHLAYDLYFQIPLGLALLFLAYYILRPEAPEKALKNKIAILIIFFAPFILIGEERDSLREGALYFQAGDFSHAEEIYEGLLDAKPPAWEQAVLLYNLGTTFLAQGDGEKAIEAFQEISPEEHLHPLLNLRVQTNSSLAFLDQVLHMKNVTADELEKSLYLSWKALMSMEAARKASCNLQKAEGSTICLPSQNLLNLEISAKKQNMAIEDKLKNFRIEQLDLSNGIPLLTASLNQFIKKLELTEVKAMSPSLRQQYRQLLIDEAEKEESLWESIQSKVNKQISKKREAVFLQAKEAYLNGISLLKSGNYSESIKAFQNSYSILDQLMKTMFADNPTKEILLRLLAFYNFAYVQTPLQESTLAALESEQATALLLMEGENRRQLELAQNGLAKGYQALQEAKSVLGKFYLIQGRQIIRRLVRKMEKVQSSESILQGAIEDQREALTLNRLRLTQGADEKDDSALLKMTQESQSQVFETAKPFLNAVGFEENKAFQTEGGKDRCQAQPWNEVLPLFEEGVRAINRPDLALSNQETALEKWEEALEKLKHPKGTFSGSCYGGGAKSQQQKNQQNDKEKNQPQQAPMQEVLRELIDMNQEDRLPQAKPSATMQMQGIRPW